MFYYKNMKEECYKQCQSCGMPLKADRQGGGTEKDGSRSCVYCSLCYRDGVFINPDRTAEEMQVLVDKVLREEVRMNRIFRWFAVKQIPRLKRWRS